jgi:ribosome-binding ATPase YchF (GTP1/OBG family)
MEEELLLADLLSAEQRLEKLDKDLKKAKSAEGEKEQHVLLRLKAHLEGGAPLRAFPWTESDEKTVRAFAFLSQKPILHLINLDEADIPRLPDFEKNPAAAAPFSAVLASCARIEREILEIDEPRDKAVFLDEYGLKETTPGRFFAAAVRLMTLVFFYTIGKDEVRAWPLRRNSTALRAAGAVHTDIEKGFIRAEVVAGDELFRCGSWQAAKDKGALRLEGRDYVVHDGDVIFFRFAP